jgi:prephenate dehydrogenase
MKEPAFTRSNLLSSSRIAIAGMGLMGGSLALALRGRCLEIIGIDPDPAALELALECGAADRVSVQPGELLPEADMIVLAAPVLAILRLLEALPNLHPGGPMVIDLGSTKRDIVRGMEQLPERFDPLGGHPMCGKETNSLRSADADLFKGRPFVFTPLERTSARARLLADELTAVLGAIPVWLDAETHDRWAAATSHAPYLIANALSSATPLEAQAVLTGSGYQSTTRIAATPPEMMSDIMTTNRENVLAALAAFRTQLDTLEAALSAEDMPALQEQLAHGAALRRSLGKKTQGGSP